MEAALAQQQHHFLKYVSSVAGRRTAVDLPCPFREPSAIGGSRALEMGVFRVSKGVSVKQCRFQRFILIAYCMIYYKYIYFLNVGFIFFFSSFKFTAKLNRKVQGSRSNVPSLPTQAQPPPPSTVCTGELTFVTIDELTLASNYHPKSIVYISVRFWCCTFRTLGKCVMALVYQTE